MSRLELFTTCCVGRAARLRPCCMVRIPEKVDEYVHAFLIL